MRDLYDNPVYKCVFDESQTLEFNPPQDPEYKKIDDQIFERMNMFDLAFVFDTPDLKWLNTLLSMICYEFKLPIPEISHKKDSIRIDVVWPINNNKIISAWFHIKNRQASVVPGELDDIDYVYNIDDSLIFDLDCTGVWREFGAYILKYIEQNSKSQNIKGCGISIADQIKMLENLEVGDIDPDLDREDGNINKLTEPFYTHGLGTIKYILEECCGYCKCPIPYIYPTIYRGSVVAEWSSNDIEMSVIFVLRDYFNRDKSVAIVHVTNIIDGSYETKEFKMAQRHFATSLGSFLGSKLGVK
jgi:hypothetical protein